ncbi:SDR family NAD(P)-dependent oxidoreductase [Ramlibacter sp. WS9]|uniref:SDR family NAD(P)-dependent oxidoreductase n=1 Tax=Ramlibacter sp. WS9 TaxID=1882741 RepID=UPI00114420CC|nr:SDR family NAD(P)-dependent oxidoreductase [Ramlibacter sp. WS9]ROZ77425.1 SDR family oxidoreductase [Ramlibacter sp. WS9]
MNQLDFKGRHAVVTGGATGLGYAIAQRLIASGGSVTIWDRDIATARDAASALGAQANAVELDVSRHESVQAAVKTTLQHNARIDALVNSAGITGPNTKVWDYPVDAWREVMEINLNGLFYCCREIVPLMQGAGYGRIVNIASVAGKEGNPNASAYSASKAAVIALTKSLGKELADTGVRVNCVTPAAVKTGMFAQMTEQHIQFMLSKIPMGRFGTPEEIAAMVCWLCTEDCSFTTGGVFDLSGGRSTY